MKSSKLLYYLKRQISATKKNNVSPLLKMPTGSLSHKSHSSRLTNGSTRCKYFDELVSRLLFLTGLLRRSLSSSQEHHSKAREATLQWDWGGNDRAARWWGRSWRSFLKRTTALRFQSLTTDMWITATGAPRSCAAHRRSRMLRNRIVTTPKSFHGLRICSHLLDATNEPNGREGEKSKVSGQVKNPRITAKLELTNHSNN